MLSLGALGFAAPWLLLAGAALPLLWWLLRLMPPAPREIAFPAIRLLFGLDPKQTTPHRSPWWLILLRLAIAGLIILGLAHPLWNAGSIFPRSGPLLIVIDDDWAAAPSWPEMRALAEERIAAAERSSRQVILLTTAPSPESGTNASPSAPALLSPGDALAQLARIDPRPLVADRIGAARRVAALPGGADYNIVWLSDGLAQERTGDGILAEALKARGSLEILGPAADRLPVLIRSAELSPTGLALGLERALAGAPQRLILQATDEEDRRLSESEAVFPEAATESEAAIALPPQDRARLAAIRILGAGHAGGIYLVPNNGGDKPIGIVADNPAMARQNLLSELYYLERALAPGSDLRAGPLSQLLAQKLSMILLPDQIALRAEDRAALKAWVAAGGTLVRFAGQRLAASLGEAKDDLLPVRLRLGDRRLGGALAWSQSARIAAFPETSPFAGLAATSEIKLARQILAEPDIDLGKKTWARLADGTPLVTAAPNGKGWLVLFHVGANAEWSDLPLTGLFVAMLDRLVDFSAGIDNATREDLLPLPPRKILDGYGTLQPPGTEAKPIPPKAAATQRVDADHPPGFYGDALRRAALNLAPIVPKLAPLPGAVAGFARAEIRDLRPLALGLAFALFLLDLAISLALRGLLNSGRRPVAAMLALFAILAIGLALPFSARAQEAPPLTDAEILAALETTHLAYVETGIAAIDTTSRAGLRGLTQILLQRSSVDIGEPVGLDIERAELSFYPLLYWPISASQSPPSPEAAARINRYLAAGGMILFDTADQNIAALGGGQGPGALRLQELARDIDIPPLTPIPADHVLSRAFYLLRDFPGRWVGGTLWVESADSRVNDGVSGIIVGSNDYASAWAIDESGYPLFPVTPGGERQREMAYRFGVNLVMYALTGNYKSDQVHVPAILERLGQ